MPSSDQDRRLRAELAEGLGYFPASLAAEDVARYRDQRTYDEALWPTDPWYDPARDPVSHMLEIRGGQRNVTTCEQLTLEVRRDCDLEYLLGGLKRLSVVRARGRHTVLRVFQPLAASSKLSAQSPWCVLPLNGTVKLIGGLGASGLSFVCCASVLAESPVPVHVQAAAVVVTPVISFQTAKRPAITCR